MIRPSDVEMREVELGSNLKYHRQKPNFGARGYTRADTANDIAWQGWQEYEKCPRDARGEETRSCRCREYSGVFFSEGLQGYIPC